MSPVSSAACYFFLSFSGFTAVTAFFLWLPRHCEKKLENRKNGITPEDHYQMRLITAVVYFAMCLDNLPWLFRDFKAVQWPQLFNLLF